MIRSIIKRDGRVVLYDQNKIAAAILKALEAAGEGDASDAARIANHVQRELEREFRNTSPDIETIQDKVLTQTNGQTRITPEMFWTYRKKGGSPHLDGQYTVFGEVVEGLDVVERIQKVFTDDYDRPVDDVRILHATVIK